MLTFIVKSKAAHLTHVNQRIEKHGDEDHLALDLKFVMNSSVDKLNQLSMETVDWEGVLFDAQGEVRAIGLKTLQFDRVFEHHGFCIRTAPGAENKREWGDVRIKKIKASPEYKSAIKLEFTVQIPIDDLSDVEFISAALLDEKVEAWSKPPKQTDMFDESEETEETAEAAE